MADEGNPPPPPGSPPPPPGAPPPPPGAPPLRPGAPPLPAAVQPRSPAAPRESRYVQKATGDAAKAYDYIAARPPGKTNSVIEAIAHLVKGCLGGGVVSIQESYKNNGLLSSLVLNILLGLLVTYCILILVRSAQKMYGRLQIPVMSYPDLAEASLATGPFPRLKKYDKCFRYAVDTTICVDLFGSCCVYLVVISKSIKQLYEKVDVVKEEGNPHLRIYILALLIPVLLLCMIRSLKYLSPFSIVADIFIIVVAGSTIYYAVKQNKTPIKDFKNYNNITGLFEFIGVCVFSMEGVGVSMAIENNMTHPKRFPVVLAGGMGIVVSMVCIVGFFGYWGFGETTAAPVTLNFAFSGYSTTLKVLMAIMIYVTFALNFWVPFNLVWYYLQKRHPPEKHWIWERVYRAMFVIGITLLAVAFPKVTSFIGLLGSFCLSNMGFIYPAFIELCLDWEEPGLGFMKWRLFKALAIMIFGVVVMCVGTYSSATSLVKDFK